MLVTCVDDSDTAKALETYTFSIVNAAHGEVSFRIQDSTGRSCDTSSAHKQYRDFVTSAFKLCSKLPELPGMDE